MAITIDAVLNFIIPPLVAIFIGWILYYPFREPIGKLIRKIKDWRENRENVEPELNVNRYIQYE